MEKFSDFFDRYIRSQSAPIYTSDALLQEACHQLILEGLFDLDEDVDFLMDKFRVEYNLEEYRKDPRHMLGKTGVLEPTIDSRELPSALSQKADKLNPVYIRFGIFDDSGYDVQQKVIMISVNQSAINGLGVRGFGNTEVIEDYPDILHEVSSHRIRSTITHELTHWLEDSLYDGKVTKEVDKLNTKFQKTRNSKDLVRFRNTSPQEIESFIHEFAQIKRRIPQDEWDSLTFKNIFDQHSSLRVAYDATIKKLESSDLEEFSKTILKRLHREGLLGKNMRTPVGDRKFGK